MSEPQPVTTPRKSRKISGMVSALFPPAKQRGWPIKIAADDLALLDTSTLDHLLVEGLAGYSIFVISQAGLIVRWNPGSSALFGYNGSEVLGRHFSMLFTPEDVAAGAPECELEQAAAGLAIAHDRLHVRKDGSRFWATNTAHALYDAGSAFLGFTKIVRDNTERFNASEAARESADRLRELLEKTQHAAVHDDLTGLANKQLFREHLDRAVSRAKRRPGHTFAVLFIDLDNFKAANARLGHLAADGLLVQVARRMEEALRTEDVVGRLGGDEFGVLVEDLECVADAVAVAEHVLASFAAPFLIEGSEIRSSASIGIALAADFGTRNLEADRLLEEADLAMYEAKSRGGARHVLFHEAMRLRASENGQLDSDLRDALERDELRVYYQPVVDVRTRQVKGLEAVVRWHHPTRGLVDEFDVRARAKTFGFATGIDPWLFKNAAHQLDSWQREIEGMAGLTVSLNMSTEDLERPALIEELRRVLAETALVPHSLVIEIDEVLSMENERVGSALSELRKIGLDVCLDDFGKTRSSFGYLSGLSATTLRISNSLTRDLTSDAQAATVFRAMLAFAHALGFKCIAHGIETEKQLELLIEIGCDEGQGPLFSGPVRPEDVRALLMC